MASIAFPSQSKSLTLPSGRIYSYVYIAPSSPSNSTVLFLHGFAATSYEWRHQISYFHSKGFGILAPDLLGYGGTSKPLAAEEYRWKQMVLDLVEIFDHEKIGKVHGVGHDFGAMVLARMINYVGKERLLSATFVAVPYLPPSKGEKMDLNQIAVQMIGVEKFGYMDFMKRQDSGKVLDDHVESFFNLYYGPESQKADFFLPGRLEAWLKADRKEKDAPFITAEEKAKYLKIFDPAADRGFDAPTNYYRTMQGDINVDDEKDLDPGMQFPCPVMMIEESPNELSMPAMNQMMKQFGEVRFKTVEGSQNHWVQLEAHEDVNQSLEGFLKDVDQK